MLSLLGQLNGLVARLEEGFVSSYVLIAVQVCLEHGLGEIVGEDAMTDRGANLDRGFIIVRRTNNNLVLKVNVSYVLLEQSSRSLWE